VIDDPFATLGLDRTATVGQLRAARRRLARQLHPDHGGDAARMQQVNAAFDAALAELTATPQPATAPDAPRGRRRPRPAERPRPGPRTRSTLAEWEPAAFMIELPVPEAFEALLVVTSWIGELASDDPPRAMEVLLAEPSPCWCRLELLPEGASTSVGIMVAGAEGVPRPSLIDVRDTWIAHLNQLAHWEALPGE
jgi:hypothetical protein